MRTRRSTPTRAAAPSCWPPKASTSAPAPTSPRRDDNPAAGNLYDEAVRLFGAATPVVAALQGAAIGGGLGLAMSADFRVGTPDTRMAANFARLGFHQGFGLSVTLPLVIGHQKALEVLYTGRRIPGEECAAIGLLDRLVAPADLAATAHALAAEIALSAPLAVASIRQTMRGPPGPGDPRGDRSRGRRAGPAAQDVGLRRGHPRHGRAAPAALRREVSR